MNYIAKTKRGRNTRTAATVVAIARRGRNLPFRRFERFSQVSDLMLSHLEFMLSQVSEARPGAPKLVQLQAGRDLAHISGRCTRRATDRIAGHNQLHSPVLLASSGVIIRSYWQSVAVPPCAD